MSRYLGVNVDHVATLRNARGGAEPCPIVAAKQALTAGADGAVAHLREDRRHIRESDIIKLNQVAQLNLEIAATEEMIAFALEIAPYAVCFVPERRKELTTESGLDLRRPPARLARAITKLKQKQTLISIFIDADCGQIDAAVELGADAIELHTGDYANASNPNVRQSQLTRLNDAAQHGADKGLEVHFGHGLNLDNLAAVAAIPAGQAFNIGHAIVACSIYWGMTRAVQAFRQIIDQNAANG